MDGSRPVGEGHPIFLFCTPKQHYGIYVYQWDQFIWEITHLRGISLSRLPVKVCPYSMVPRRVQFSRVTGQSWWVVGKEHFRPRSSLSLSPAKVFSYSERTLPCDSGRRVVVWMLFIDRARHPSPTGKPHAEGDSAKHVGIEVLNIGCWLTHGDAAFWRLIVIYC